ncbi:hypothetical protein Tco_0810348 [Tanacetum coccineum]
MLAPWPISVPSINPNGHSPSFEKLNLQRLTKTRMILELADRSISTPTGIAEDVFVKVGTFRSRSHRTDFVVELMMQKCDLEKDILLLDAFLICEPVSVYHTSHHANYFPEVMERTKICEAKTAKTSIYEPPEVDLKDLPPHLEYAFLEDDNKLPVIIAKDLSVAEKAILIRGVASPTMKPFA